MKKTIILMTIVLFISIAMLFILDNGSRLIYFFWGTTGVSLGTILGNIRRYFKNKKMAKQFVFYILLVFVLTALLSYFILLYIQQNSLIYVVVLNVIGLSVALRIIIKGMRSV